MVWLRIVAFLLLCGFLTLSPMGEVCIYLWGFSFRVIIDPISISFSWLLVLIIRRVYIWSFYYMREEEYFSRFLIIVNRFVFRILTLIFIGNLFFRIIGWDGLGVTSFLLIVFYKNRKSLASGFLTAFTNRLGDGFYLVLLSIRAGTLGLTPQRVRFWFTSMLILLSITKRAQVPFTSWLPAAMAAPTPVRALVHSSTLVTAGVYMLLRYNAKGVFWLVLVGRCTLFIAGVAACAESDLKKIVALSTLSQLGVMVVSLSIFQKSFCFFHLITHAMFKALLFLRVGVGIHRVYGTQDLRSFRGLSKGLSIPCVFLVCSSLSLLGFPFMSGFYRKDIIMESFYNNSLSFLFSIVFLCGVGLTAAYSFKVVFLVVGGGGSFSPFSLSNGSFSPFIKIPFFVLGTGSVIRGALLSLGLPPFSPVFSPLDKLWPLFFILLGSGGGFIVRLYFSSSTFCSLLYLIPLFHGTRRILSLGSEAHQGDSNWVRYVGGRRMFSSFSFLGTARWRFFFSMSFFLLLFFMSLA